jgi:hypothetical protein
MAANQNREPGPPAGWIRPVFIAVLVILFLLLGQSMRRHHFFDGATYENRNGGTHP